MYDMNKWNDKLKNSRKNTNFDDFVMEIWSWQIFTLYKIDWKVSRYPDIARKSKLVDWNLLFEVNWTIDSKNYYVDNKKDFFDLMLENLKKSYLPYLWIYWDKENSEFADMIWYVKNIYLSLGCINAENVLYTHQVWDWKNILNTVYAHNNSENIYSCILVNQSFNVFYSKNISNCSYIYFSVNLKWCQECILCEDLENQAYCIKNKKYDKNEYLKLKNEILSKKDNFNEYHENILKKDIDKYNVNCSNFWNWFYNNHINEWNNVIWWTNLERAYDCYWWLDAQDIYWCLNVWLCNNLYFCINSWLGSSFLYYCIFCINCSFCVWCIWLKNKSYCIFNVQYEKNEWYQKVNEIFNKMESDWNFWKFLPWKLSPFYFNDSLAYLMNDNIDKKIVTGLWFMRRDEKISIDIPNSSNVIQYNELYKYQWFDKDWYWKIDKDILNKIIIDENWDIYKIISMEYDFLTKFALPLPRKHWLQRIKDWFKRKQ